MSEPFTPLTLAISQKRNDMAYAGTRDTAEFLTGFALRAVIAERIEQISEHGHTPTRDLAYDQAELALAGKSYLDTAIDLALRPDLQRKQGDAPESWPWQYDFWKEPGPADRMKALVKAAALILAEIDREHSAQRLIDAARPLIETPPETPIGKAVVPRGMMHRVDRGNEIQIVCGCCSQSFYINPFRAEQTRNAVCPNCATPPALPVSMFPHAR